MGYDTWFHGKLEFTRRLNKAELECIERIAGVGSHYNWPEAVREAVQRRSEEEQAARGHGPLVVLFPQGAELAAEMQGYVTGEGLNVFDADSLGVSEDGKGLIHISEKTYDMIGGVNFIIVNARNKIPDFGLAGMLAADTEFEPYLWFVKIGKDGLAYQKEATRREFFAFRRKCYPEGYKGWGRVEPKRPITVTVIKRWLGPKLGFGRKPRT